MRAVAARPSAAAMDVTSAEAMDWAESHYPDFFPAVGRSAGYAAPYAYRYYAGTGNYLAASVDAEEITLYVDGSLTGGQALPLGRLADYACTVKVPDCPYIAAWGDSLTAGVAAHIQDEFPDRAIYNGGIAGQTSVQIATRQISDRVHQNWVNTLWLGHNNVTEPARIKADLAACIAAMSPGNDRFIVLSLLNRPQPDQWKGTPIWQGVLQLNADLAAAYPQHYLDVRSYLVNQYDPAQPQDVIDFQNDVVPASLHDGEHLNAAGYALVARKVREFVDAKGW